MEVSEKNMHIEGDTTPLDKMIRFRLFGTKTGCYSLKSNAYLN